MQQLDGPAPEGLTPVGPCGVGQRPGPLRHRQHRENRIICEQFIK